MAAFKLRREYAVFRGGVLLCAIGAALLPRAAEAQWGSPGSTLRRDHRVHQVIGSLRQRAWLAGSGMADSTKARPQTRLKLASVASGLLAEVEARASGLDYSLPRSGPRQRLIPGAMSAADFEELRGQQAQLLEGVRMVREVVLELQAELNGSGVSARASLRMLDAVERRLERLDLVLQRLLTEFEWHSRISGLLRRSGIASS